MRIVLATTCTPVRHEPLTRQDVDHSPCGVEGLAAAIGADTWIGGQISDEFTKAAREADVVVLNGNTKMTRIAPELADALSGSGTVLALLQEGDARVWVVSSPVETLNWMRAAHAADVLLLYNHASHARQWESLTGGTPARRIRLPHPSDIMDYALPWHRREHSVMTGSGCVPCRGGIASLALARSLDETTTVYTYLGHYSDRSPPDGAKDVARVLGGTVIPWNRRNDYARILARCRFAVNLDPSHTYGRFAADCATLGVPCVGLSSMPMQAGLWPDLTVRENEDPVRRIEEWRDYLWNRPAWEEVCAAACKWGRVYTAEHVRKMFVEAMDGVLLQKIVP